ncbi:MAG: SDR family NAD(P)-dependent oxidoreductase [Gemmatimonadales bacterium]|nr:SDR family NAD(P)-dependent oxidoreductase [Gemmatimonadales bacterium]
MQFTDKVCVVTGATEGIGRAVAAALASRGARLAVCARTAERVEGVVAELRASGATAVGRTCDVGDERAVESFAAFARAEYGHVDVLVNNAGLAHFVSVAEMRTADFDETMAVNVRGTFLMTRAFLPDMIERRQGHIVNVASLAGRNPVPNGAAYSAAKHAVLGFSKSLFAEVRKHGVRVTAICPGSVVTPFFDKSGVPLDRPEAKLQPEDVAETVVAALQLPERALVSELDIRPTNP